MSFQSELESCGALKSKIFVEMNKYYQLNWTESKYLSIWATRYRCKNNLHQHFLTLHFKLWFLMIYFLNRFEMRNDTATFTVFVGNSLMLLTALSELQRGKKYCLLPLYKWRMIGLSKFHNCRRTPSTSALTEFSVPSGSFGHLHVHKYNFHFIGKHP